VSQWGLVLVEKRPSRGKRDGIIVLEKAQERKRICNLEIPKGINKTSISALHNPAGISVLADDVGINLEDTRNARDESILEVMKNVEDRAKLFDMNCEVSLNTGEPAIDVSGPEDVVEEDGAPSTPSNQPVISQVEGAGDDKGQWTQVVNRKKSKVRKVK
jgi:hypothetical protein